ncbi:MAG: GGDEF domain-containing protein [Roseburia sp.]|nr:GGDEF domain-containing protein [Roseburia sp.]
MQYNYDFEIASLLIMTIILLHFVCIRQFPGEKTKAFGMFLVTCTAECAANIISSIGLANAALVPQFANELLAFAFFALEGLASYLLFCYFMVVCRYEGRKRKLVRVFGAVPFAFFCIMLALTPFLGFFYYFKDGAYHQGFGAGFGYAYIAYFFLLNIILIVRRRSVVNLRTKWIVSIYTAVAIAMIVIQYHVRGVLLTSVGNTVVLLMLYLELQNPSEHLDSVTGIGNESAFEMQLKKRLAGKAEGTVMTIHLRKFHYIHTVVGLDNSNELLRQVGAYLYRLCGKFHVFYMAGDLFAVFADTAEDRERIEAAVWKRFDEEWVVQENRILLNIEMVIQHYPADFDTAAEFFGMRQFLLEEAAKSGLAESIETDEDLVEQYHRRRKIELAVAAAIRDKSFEVYYQPVYSLREKRIVSLEALVRLHDEELGYISPEEFIPLAERDGNIIHIGAQVLEECCRFLSRHVLSNLSLGIRTVHVNISMAQCLQQNLTETIAPVLEKYHIPPSMLTLEITERTAITTPERMLRHMKELGKMGVSFAMDDYGSGNANCSYLIRFPFQEIKIDKAIVWAAFEDEKARIVLENEIKTIQRLGIPLVIEGVERREQSEMAEKLGVDYIQGYYYGRPLPEQECLRYIRSFNSVPENYARQ